MALRDSDRPIKKLPRADLLVDPLESAVPHDTRQQPPIGLAILDFIEDQHGRGWRVRECG